GPARVLEHLALKAFLLLDPRLYLPLEVLHRLAEHLDGSAVFGRKLIERTLFDLDAFELRNIGRRGIESTDVAGSTLNLLGLKHDVSRAGVAALEILNVPNDYAIVPLAPCSTDHALDAVGVEEFTAEIVLKRVADGKERRNDVGTALFVALLLRGQSPEVASERRGIFWRVREVDCAIASRLEGCNVGPRAVVDDERTPLSVDDLAVAEPSAELWRSRLRVGGEFFAERYLRAGFGGLCRGGKLIFNFAPFSLDGSPPTASTSRSRRLLTTGSSEARLLSSGLVGFELGVCFTEVCSYAIGYADAPHCDDFTIWQRGLDHGLGKPIAHTLHDGFRFLGRHRLHQIGR